MPQNSLGLTVDSEFTTICPDLTDEEFKQLRENIEADGFTESIKAWKDENGNNLIIDGHHRYRIWAELPDGSKVKPPKVEQKKFGSRAEAVNWVIFNQLGRRNLPSKKRALLIGKLYQEMKKPVGRPAKSEQTPKKQGSKNGEAPSPFPRTAEEVAEKAGVSSRTVKTANKFTEAIDTIRQVNSKAADDIVSGALPLSQPDTVKLANSKDIGKELRNLRKGPPAKPKPKRGKKTEAVSAAKLVDELTKKHVGHIARGLTAIAKANGGEGDQFKAADDGLNQMIRAMKAMREGKQ